MNEIDIKKPDKSVKRESNRMREAERTRVDRKQKEKQ